LLAHHGADVRAGDPTCHNGLASRGVVVRVAALFALNGLAETFDTREIEKLGIHVSST
jgi:hypothetical protein